MVYDELNKFLYFITLILQRFRITMILQCIRIIERDAGFEPVTSAPEVWCTTNEPSHLLSHHISYQPPQILRKLDNCLFLLFKL